VEWLNYHHLYYFWAVVREGSITRAAARLRLAQPTISGQLKALEAALGEPLLVRDGRHLRATATGEMVFRYADQIFGLGRELMAAVRGRGALSGRLAVGIADVLPKSLCARLLAPVLTMAQGLVLSCRTDKHERLLAALAIHGVDVVLSDAPVDRSVHVRAYNHLLGDCGVTMMASPRLGLARGDFPRCLDQAPMLMPGEGTALRQSLGEWLEGQGIAPSIVAVVEDPALLKGLGEAGVGIFPTPSVMADETVRRYRVEALGTISAVRERIFAITTERRLRHPGLLAIAEVARSVFAGREPEATAASLIGATISSAR